MEEGSKVITIWWEQNDGSRNIEIGSAVVTGRDIMEAVEAKGWLRPWQKILIEELPNGTGRIIGQSENINLRNFMKFSAIANDDND